MQMKNPVRLLLAVALLTLSVDQSSKLVAMGSLTSALSPAQGLARVGAFFATHGAQPTRELTVVEGLLSFKYSENAGVTANLWSTLPQRLRQPVLVFVSLVALGFIGFMLSRVPPSQRRLRITLSVVMGGAVGNLLDRVLRGAVIDFIDLHWRDRPMFHFPAFNLADVAISFGMAVLLLDALQVRPGMLAQPGEPLSGAHHP